MATHPKKKRIPLHIGAPVWRIDYGGPGEMTQARGVRVESETRMSWVLANGVKIPKAWAEPRFDVDGFRTTPYCLTREAAETMLLRHNQSKFASMVLTCADDDTLRKVADALGVSVDLRD